MNDQPTIRKGDPLDVLNDAGTVLSSKTIHSVKADGPVLQIVTEDGLTIRIGRPEEQHADRSSATVQAPPVPGTRKGRRVLPPA